MYKQGRISHGRKMDNLPKSYCGCWTNENSTKKPLNEDSKSGCRCGEQDSLELEWIWQNSEYSTTRIKDREVFFHPVYSQGTAMVRGDPLPLGYHHYWEIKMTSTVCGTDVMVGVGTQNVDLYTHKYRFLSLLGMDDQSWGFSYRGIAQHAGESRYYGQKFGQGSIVGVHLDLFRGTLEFYVNRLPLGIVFRNLEVTGRYTYYAMVSSTAAKSSVKLINSSSFPESLQYQAMKTISRRLPGIKYPTGLKSMIDRLWMEQRMGIFHYNNQTLGSPIEGNSERSVDDETNIYDDIDQDIQRIRENQNRYATSSSEEEDNSNEMILFSYFCDHLA